MHNPWSEETAVIRRLDELFGDQGGRARGWWVVLFVLMVAIYVAAAWAIW
jgi:hypothetical protein